MTATTILLVRHAVYDGMAAFLAGRTNGIKLGQEGLAQAQLLGLRLAKEQANDIFTSARERAQETATAIANACGTHDESWPMLSTKWILARGLAARLRI